MTKRFFRTPVFQSCSLQPQLVDALTTVRLDWESAANGKSLLYEKSSVGLVLFDIVSKLNVPVEEQRFLLGQVLFDEASEFVRKQG